MSRDELLTAAMNAKAHAAEYTAWAEQDPRNSARYLGYAVTRLADARWYLERAERLAVTTEERIAA